MKNKNLKEFLIGLNLLTENNICYLKNHKIIYPYERLKTFIIKYEHEFKEVQKLINSFDFTS
jgi:hypothetical protein